MTGTLSRDTEHVPDPPPRQLDDERNRLLPSWWALGTVTIGYPVLYLLGLASFSWIIVGCAVLPAAFFRRPVRVPPGMGTWLLFLAWALMSALTLTAVDRVLAFAFRYLLYLGATGFFFRTYNSLRSGRLTVERVMGLLTVLWGVTVVGGLIGTILPTLVLRTPMQIILPGSIANHDFIGALIAFDVAQVQNLWGAPIGRPNAPFPYTNAWGSTLSILFPIAIAWLIAGYGSRRSRLTVRVLMAASVIPIVISLNRGLWLTLGLTVLFVCVRLALLGRVGGLVRITTAGLIVGLLLLLTPLGGLITQRNETAHSDEGRLSLYSQAIDLTLDSPILGWGAPQPRADKDGPSVGTHGHLWLTLVSHGIPGTVLFIAFWMLVIGKTWMFTSTASLWFHSAIVSMLVQIGFYELLPAQLPIGMIVGATLLALRADRRTIDRTPAMDSA